MKRCAGILGLFVLLFIAVGSVGAQGARVSPVPRANNPPVEITALSHDNLANAYVFYPNLAIHALNVETNSFELGEAVHSCTSSIGTYTLWFATNLPAGKLTLKTAGTNYVSGVDSSDDTVISIYSVSGDQTVVDYTTLVPLACNANGTGAGRLKNVNLAGGTYLVQISFEGAVALTAGSTVDLLATFKPKVKISNDSISKPRAMTFPQLYTFGLMLNATAALNEPVDPFAPVGTVLGRTVWFKFSLSATNAVVFQSGLIMGTGLLSLYKVGSNGSLTPVELVPTDVNLLPFSVVGKGNYLLRLGTITAQVPPGQLAAFSVNFLQALVAVQSYTPPNLGFGTDEGTVTAAGSLDGWTVANATLGSDQLVCGAPLQVNHCGYQLGSAGVGESTSLTGTVKLKSAKLLKGELMEIGLLGVSSGSSASVRIVIELSDAAGHKAVFTRISTLLDESIDFIGVMPRAMTVTKAKVTITNLTATPGDTVTIDTVVALAIRIGTPVGREGTAGVLPVPPPAQ